MHPETAWDELTAAALLGTERRPFVPPAVTEPLASIVSAVAGREPEQALLGTAAALSLFRRAGRRPQKRETIPLEPAAIDDRPPCSATSNSHLALMLSGVHADVLPEWLDARNESGKRPADETWPDLLELGRSKPDLRPKVVAAVGPLGVWLARQNPDWAYASGIAIDAVTLDDATIDARWQDDTTEGRVALLRHVRPANSARARDLVASTWKTDGPDVRAKFVETFETGLSLDDEPFLEAALDDRRKEVRTAASDLLRRLPGSALVTRMIEQVAPLLKVVEVNPGQIAIEATLPETLDKAMIRDGIEAKLSTYLGLGEKANWLYQMVARVPPSHWSRAWERSPADLVQAILRSEWNEALYSGLLEAAIQFNDSDWADALSAQTLPFGTKANLLELIKAQKADRREAMVVSLIRALDPGQPIGGNLSVYMNQIPAPWGDELSRLVLERFVLLSSAGNYYYVANDLATLGLRVSTSVALASPPDLSIKIADPPAYLVEQVRNHADHFHALIQFRHEMIQELRR